VALTAALALTVPAAAATAKPARPSRAADKPANLLGRAVLPAQTFARGPISGQYINPLVNNGITAPFPGQPVQGISAAIPGGNGEYWVMPDNGYGTIETSADFNLRVYLVKPSFRTELSGTGKVRVERFIQLHDPNHKIDFPIVHQWTRSRVLTGADFDIESLQRAPDGTLWFGDEFGPFLIHTDANGKVLAKPYPLPDFQHPGQQIRSPQNPYSEESATLRAMNALRGDAQQHGDRNTPIVSPDADLIDDGDPSTGIASRIDPPAGSGLRPASSELFNVASLHAAGFKVVPYTVDDPARMDALISLGVDGIITDRPDLLRQEIAKLHPEWLRPDGSVDGSRFDAEAHRGGRDLRPENTLPSMEVGLDNLVTTLETDNGITKDGVPVLSHDPYIDAGRCRRTDGKPYTEQDQVLYRDITFAQMQKQFICDGLIRPGTPQTNDRSLSPVAVAFARQERLIDPYVIPSLQQLFDFVTFYGKYYTTGAGRDDPNAAARAAEASRVRFNIETKLNPRSDRDTLGNRWDQRTIRPKPFTETVARTIERSGMADRSDVQSFDFTSLRIVHREFPNLPTVALWGDSPEFADQSIPGSDDGDNMQPQGREANTRWLAGLEWPYRSTRASNPFRAQQSGGFESMALTSNGKTLIPMLEEPFADEANATPKVTHAFAFDLKTDSYTGETWTYPYDPRGVSVPDFQMVDKTHGITLERDGSQGTTDGFKAIEGVTLPPGGGMIAKQQDANLLDIADPAGISLPAMPGDVGLGNPFAFPFQTIETLVVLNRREVLVANDNNFPFSVGRHVGSGLPDDNEFIVVRLPKPIGS